MPTASSSRFDELLAQLNVEHNATVDRLFAEIDFLRAEIERLSEAGRQASTAVVEVALTTPTTDACASDGSSRHNTDANDSPAQQRSNDTPAQQKSQFSSEGTSRGLLAKNLSLRSRSNLHSDEFLLRGVWQEMPEDSRLFGRDADQNTVSCHLKNLAKTTASHLDDDDDNEERGPLRSKVSEVTKLQAVKCIGVVSPSNTYRMAWDLSGMVLISYDMITIPINISFDPAENPFTNGMGWFTLIFWTADMFTSLFTGYYYEGKLEMSHSKIIVNYLKGWLWVDLAVVVPDWVMKLMGSTVSVAGLGRILRALRVMRILRLLRVMKLKKVVNMVYNLIDSEYMFIVFNLAKLLLMILILNHMVACAWFFVGKMSKNTGAAKNWLQDIGMTPVWGTDLEWQYLTALHWSITQFTPASMDIYATNIPERIFSIAILFWALVALSSIIGSVSASMTALRNMSSDEMKQFWLLRRYMKQKRISAELKERIEKFLEYRWVEQTNAVDPTKVKLLSQLSDQLTLELFTEMSSPLLKNHLFFQALAMEVPAIMFRICSQTLKHFSYAMQDLCFQPGEECSYMFFVKFGTFEYQVDGVRQETPLGARSWVAEAILWTSWVHRGFLRAREPSDLIGIKPNSFSDVLRMHVRTWEMAHGYGTKFVHFMNQCSATALTDVLWQFGPESGMQWGVFDDEGLGDRACELLEALRSPATQAVDTEDVTRQTLGVPRNLCSI